MLDTPRLLVYSGRMSRSFTDTSTLYDLVDSGLVNRTNAYEVLSNLSSVLLEAKEDSVNPYYTGALNDVDKWACGIVSCMGDLV